MSRKLKGVETLADEKAAEVFWAFQLMTSSEVSMKMGLWRKWPRWLDRLHCGVFNF